MAKSKKPDPRAPKTLGEITAIETGPATAAQCAEIRREACRLHDSYQLLLARPLDLATLTHQEASALISALETATSAIRRIW